MRKLHIGVMNEVHKLGGRLYVWEVPHVGKCLRVVVCRKVYGGGGVVFESMGIESCIEGRGHRYMVVVPRVT